MEISLTEASYFPGVILSFPQHKKAPSSLCKMYLILLSGTPLGLKIEHYLNNTILVPSELVVNALIEGINARKN